MSFEPPTEVTRSLTQNKTTIGDYKNSFLDNRSQQFFWPPTTIIAAGITLILIKDKKYLMFIKIVFLKCESFHHSIPRFDYSRLVCKSIKIIFWVTINLYFDAPQTNIWGLWKCFFVKFKFFNCIKRANFVKSLDNLSQLYFESPTTSTPTVVIHSFDTK